MKKNDWEYKRKCLYLQQIYGTPNYIYRMILRRIYSLLNQRERNRGIWVSFSVLIRALLDFAGVAALIPILLTVFGEKADLKKGSRPCRHQVRGHCPAVGRSTGSYEDHFGQPGS